MPTFDRRFVLAGLAFTVLGGSALGAVNLALVHASLGPVLQTHVQAHAHAQTFGFILLFIAGFGGALLPRMVHRPLRWPALARASFGLLAGGAALHFFGQPVARWWPGRLLVGLSAPLLVAGAAATAANTFALTLRFRTPYRFERWVQLAAALLVAAALLDALLAARVALGGPDDALYPAWGAQPLWHLAVYGVGVPYALGIALRTLPAFTGSGPVRPRPARLALALLAAGVPVQALAYGLLGGDAPWRAPLDAVARAVEGAGLLTACAAFRWNRSRLPLGAAAGRAFARAARLAFAWLALAGTLRLGTAAAQALGASPSALVFDAERHLVTIGFLITLILAMAQKLLPVLEGVPLRHARLGPAALALVTVGVIARTVQALAAAGFPGLLAVSAFSGVAVWLGLALLAAMVVPTLRSARAAALPPRRASA
jgi:hypothetical protein